MACVHSWYKARHFNHKKVDHNAKLSAPNKFVSFLGTNEDNYIKKTFTITKTENN